MPLLLMHRDTVFEDDTVLLRGNAFVNCTFRRCTLVFRDGVSMLESCSFESCIWHIDYVVSDREEAEALVRMLGFIEQGLPQPAATEANTPSPPGD